MTGFSSPLRRLLTFTTAISLVLPALPASAQDAGSPPARVGQIANLSGGVSFNGSGSGSGGWVAATPNYPVSDGDSLYTQNGSQAAIALDASKITLSGNTELQITQLDQNVFAATESQGESFFSINYLQPGQSFTIATPRGTVSIGQNGQYDIAAGDANTPTTVTVFQGAATVTDPGATLQVAAGQEGVLSGSDQTTAQLGQAQPDGFASAMLAQTAPPPPSYAPPVVNQMSGAGELSAYGTWDQSPQYGAVWYPRVDPGWAPYREGHWVNVAPWGWTWVESEPWGFAPFHYGRWVNEDDRWGWAPAPAYQGGGDYGPDYRPVYAPAVVSFFGLAVVAGITAAALSSGSVGWVPLGPEEPYYPCYRASPDYIRRINIVNVRNINNVNITNNYYGGRFAPDHFANRRAATFIPADAMRRGDPVARYGRPVPQNEFAEARPIDPGFGARPAGAPQGQPAFRLPPPNPGVAHGQPGIAPRPNAFADRLMLPPAVVSHVPPGYAGPNNATFRPLGGQGGGRQPGGAPPENRPVFGANPGYHAPPPPPGMGERPAQLPAGHLPALQTTRPAEPARPAGAPQMFQPQQARPALPQVVYPSVARPAAPVFRPQGQSLGQPAVPPVFHPQDQARPAAPPVFHPQEQPQVFHPQPPQPVFHPAEPARAPEPARPEPSRPEPAPGQHLTH